MRTLRRISKILCAVAIMLGLCAVSVSFAAPNNKAAVEAKKKQAAAAKNRARDLTASRNADKVKLTKQQQAQIEKAQEDAKKAREASVAETQNATSTQTETPVVAETQTETPTVAEVKEEPKVAETNKDDVIENEITQIMQVADYGDTKKGQKLYKACAVCHGSDGKKQSPGQIEGRSILSREYEDLVKELIAYREGTADNGGLEVIMTANMEGWTDEEIQEVAKYVMKLVAENQKELLAKESKKQQKQQKQKQASNKK